jgi:diacylglycerol kinase (CTP)
MKAVMTFDATMSARLNEMMTELHELVSRLQTPKPSNQNWRQAVLDRCAELVRLIAEILAEFRQTMEASGESIKESLEGIAEKLRGYSSELGRHPNARRLKSMYRTLSDGYEELLVEIRELKQAGLLSTARARHLKPMNYARNVFHAMMGVTGVLMYQFVLGRTAALAVMLCLLSVFGTLEITRRFSPRWNDFLVDRVFGIIARPHERHHVNGSTWFLIALVVIVFLYPKNVVIPAVLILSFADPAASVAGKLWGGRKIVHGKSYVGSLAFLAIAFCISLPFALAVHSIAVGMLTAAAIALAGTLAELFITGIDDNFSIPIVCATAGYFLL